MGEAAATNILIAVMGIGSGVICARTLGATGRGQLAVIQLWPVFIAGIAMIGMPEALVYFTARRANSSRHLLVQTMKLASLAGIFIGAIGILILPIILSTYPASTVRTSQIVLVLMIAVFILGGLPGQSLRGLGHWRMWNLLRLVAPLTWLLLLAIALLSNVTSANTYGLLFGLSQVVGAIPFLIAGWRGTKTPFTQSETSASELLRFGAPAGATMLPDQLSSYLDRLAVSSVASAQQNGIYAVATAWSAGLAPLFQAISAVLLPRLSAQNRDYQIRTINAMLPRLVLLAIALGLPLAVLAPAGIPLLFGDSFSGAVGLACVLSLAAAASGLVSNLRTALQGIGNPGVALVASIGGGLILAALIAILMRSYGTMGAAVATLIGYSITALIMVYCLRLSVSSDP